VRFGAAPEAIDSSAAIDTADGTAEPIPSCQRRNNVFLSHM